MLTINKAQMIDIMAEKADLTKSQAKSTLDSFTEGVSENLKQGFRSIILGLGVFSGYTREAKRVRHPTTGKYIDLPKATLVRFKNDMFFEECINKDKERFERNIQKRSKGKTRCTVTYNINRFPGTAIEAKKEMIESMAEHANISKDSAGRALDAFIETVTETLGNGGKVVLLEFGTFFASFKPESEIWNPVTHELETVSALGIPKFKPSRILKEEVNKLTKT